MTLYSLHMASDIIAFAKAASASLRVLAPFEARETIHGGKIRAEAAVRCFAPNRIVVSYSAYESPIAELDDLWGGDAEFAPADLVGTTLTSDGNATWIVSPRTGTAFSMLGRLLYEPIPGYDTLGELRCLDDLSRDFLLRDAGEGCESGRPTRTIGLKPKRQRVASLFRVTSFSAERADVTFDAESYFPLRIAFRPPRGAPISSLVPHGEDLTVEYRDVRHIDAKEWSFPPALPAGVRVFEELLLPRNDAARAVPFPLPVTALEQAGYALIGDRVRVVLDAPREKGYAILPFAKSDDRGSAEAAVILRVGNYLSRLMARRRAMASDRGEQVTLSDVVARFFDHRTAWGEAQREELPLLADLAWEHGGLFWMVSSDGLERDALLSLALALL